jgi:penicillin-binding protein 1C
VSADTSSRGAQRRSDDEASDRRRLWNQPLRRCNETLQRWKGLLRRCAATLLVSAVLALALIWLVPLPARLAVPASTVVAFADGSPAHVFLSPDDKVRIRADLDRIDPDYLRALLRFEDKRFWRHPGVDPAALLRAGWLDLRSRRAVSGGSTLTMQLVRMLEPRPRTLGSKAVEALRALQLEARLSKRQILTAYLTYAPYGGNLEGVEAACWAYFAHSAEALVPEEIATLLAVPQQPGARSPSARNAARLTAARATVAARLLEAGALRTAGAEPRDWPVVPTRVRPVPRHAPHAAYWLRARAGGRERIVTTLDRGAQLVAERTMARAHGDLRLLGIDNGAVVIADHAAGEVRALVGNFDFWDGAHGGQIAGFDVPRSPGSALKPLVYALAVDHGLALPDHLVPDVPVAYGNYTPQNFDGRFAGLVSLDDALSQSLNVPFVRLLDQLGLESFLGTLRAAGFRHLRDGPGFYGLSAAIGAVDVTPLEMAGLYAALAEDGRWRPLRIVASEGDGTKRGTRSEFGGPNSVMSPAPRGVAVEADDGPRLFSPGAAWLTRHTLSRRDRPDFPERRKWSGAPAHVHWKTGTSYGHRDAWAIGSGARYTAAVWLGNFDNRPAVDLVGADAAGPLLFDLLEALEPRRLPRPDPAPAGMESVEVCAYSGYLPGPACPTRKRVLAVRAAVPTRRCPFHVAVDVDLTTGLALQPACRGGHRWETRSYVTWPASLRRWLGDRHRWLPEPPPLAPGCEAPPEPGDLRILSPLAGQVLVLLPGLPTGRQEVPLQAESGGGDAVAWFVDGEYLGSARAEQRVWWRPRPGAHRIVVVDAAGRTAQRELQVREGLSGAPAAGG